MMINMCRGVWIRQTLAPDFDAAKPHPHKGSLVLLLEDYEDGDDDNNNGEGW